MFQKVIICGNLGNDPESKSTQSGTTVTAFNVATEKVSKGEKVTSWHRIKTFGKTAENCAQYLQKGAKVLIEGEINYGSYEKDGEKKYYTEIIAYTVKFLDPRDSGQYQQGNHSRPEAPQVPQGSGGGFDDGFDGLDVPF